MDYHAGDKLCEVVFLLSGFELMKLLFDQVFP